MGALAACALVLAAVVVVLSRLQLRRTIRGLNAMLDAAIRGSFSETAFDESRISAVQSKLRQYLGANAVSAERLAAEKAHMQQLTADISHQTKTPVANIKLYAGLLSEQALPEGCLAPVRELQAQADKLEFLLDALVKAGRLETGVIAVQPRALALAPMVQAVAAQAAGKAENKGVRLTFSETTETALFDPKWTQEALFNLVDNAVKYTPAGGAVSVSVTAYELFCRIDVRDTGIGLPENEQARIFERFYRAPAARDEAGVGLGLYLARTIAQAGGGYIKVRAAPGQGSTFSLFLPRG